MNNFFLKTLETAGFLTGYGDVPFASAQRNPLKPIPNPEQVTPGTSGFLAVLAMAVALIVLAILMTRSIRKVRYQPYPDEAAKKLPSPAVDKKDGIAEDQ